MPTGKPRKKHPELYGEGKKNKRKPRKRHYAQIRATTDTSLPDDPDTAYLRGVCKGFLDALPHPKILDPVLFTTLNDEAQKLGFRIAAHQRGIHGTYLCFEPC